MGAATAAVFASRYPDLLSCLVLEDPPWSDDVMSVEETKTMMENWKGYHLKTQTKSLPELIAWQKKTSPNWEEEILPQWAEGKLAMDITIFDHFKTPSKDWREVAQAIQVPTLIITGDNDRGAIVKPSLGVEAVELLSHGEFGHISHAGHCVRYEQFQAYLTMVKLFLKRNLKG
jgi:pimeloyl-ACP methyl ester carboxylesterase